MQTFKNLKTNIFLNPKEEESYQLILASQQLGTFFCVYANFKKESDDEYAVKFYLQNYKGAVNLALKSPKIKNHDGVISIISLEVGLQSSEEKELICEKEKLRIKTGGWIVCELDVEVGKNEYQVFNTERYYRNPVESDNLGRNNGYDEERENARNVCFSFLKKKLGDDFPTSIKYKDLNEKAVGDFCVIGITQVF